MKFYKHKTVLFFLSLFVFFFLKNSYSGEQILFDPLPTDAANSRIMGFFDLRDRETFIQITNTGPNPNGLTYHVQIFDVSNNCNENDFFDFYTPNDTHVYDLRNLQTNDGNPSGVVLPDGAYGIFAVVNPETPFSTADFSLIGNLRVIDQNGYEYRTNLVGNFDEGGDSILGEFGTFNFNTRGGTTLSDVILITPEEAINNTDIFFNQDDILNVWTTVDVNIYDLNEVPFSCRKIIFSCVNQNSTLYEELLETAANEDSPPCNGNCGASVADFEYGINDAIPHTKGGELLCPGNIISEGFVRLEILGKGMNDQDGDTVIFVGLNNGNGRGSLDSIFFANDENQEP